MVVKTAEAVEKSFMKILFVGNRNVYFLNTNHYREQALLALGHEVVFFDIRSYWLKARIRQWFPFLDHWDLSRINKNIVRRAVRERFDLCVVIGGQNVFPWAVKEIREAGVPIALWTTDPPHPGTFERVRTSAGEYTKVFCAGTEAMELLWQSGFKKAVWLPFCAEPKVHDFCVLSSEEKRRYGHDIVFVGSYYPNRRDVFGALVDLDLGVWGALWDRLPVGDVLKKKVIALHTDVTVWTKIYSAAKIVLVVHFHKENTPCDQASPKLFEAMSCGSFVLCDDQKDARTLFRDREHLVFFKDAVDLRAKVEYYLAHPDERERIACQGKAEVRARHTYEKRMAMIMLETLFTAKKDLDTGNESSGGL